MVPQSIAAQILFDAKNEQKPTTEEMMKRQYQPVKDCKDPFDKIRRDSEAVTTGAIEDEKWKDVVDTDSVTMKALAITKGMARIIFPERAAAEACRGCREDMARHAEIAANILDMETKFQRWLGDPSYAFNARERSIMHDTGYQALAEAVETYMVNRTAMCNEGCLQNIVLLIN